MDVLNGIKDWMGPLGGLASGVAAVLAWLAKIKWSKEYTAAKEAQIETLKQQVKSLESLGAEKLRAHMDSAIAIHEAKSIALEGQMKIYEEQRTATAEEIAKLKAEGRGKDELVQKMESKLRQRATIN